MINTVTVLDSGSGSMAGLCTYMCICSNLNSHDGSLLLHQTLGERERGGGETRGHFRISGRATNSATNANQTTTRISGIQSNLDTILIGHGPSAGVRVAGGARGIAAAKRRVVGPPYLFHEAPLELEALDELPAHCLLHVAFEARLVRLHDYCRVLRVEGEREGRRGGGGGEREREGEQRKPDAGAGKEKISDGISVAECRGSGGIRFGEALSPPSEQSRWDSLSAWV